MKSKIKEMSDNEMKELDKINESMRKERFKKVIELSLKAKKKYPEQILFFISHSIGNSQLGNSTEALRILMEADKLFTGDYEIYFQIAKVYEDMDLDDKAEEYFMKSYVNTPEDHYEARSDCMNDIGALKYNQGKEDDAFEYFEKALELNPDNKKARENLYLLEDDYEDDLEDDEDDYEDDEDDDEEDSYYDTLDEGIHLFQDIQQGLYLKNKKRKKFKSEAEEEKVNMHILAEWTNKIAGQMELMVTLNEVEKIKWFNSVEIDFSGEPPEIEMPEIRNPVYEKMAGKLDFLPPNGVSFVLLAFPFLEALGISDDGFNVILDKDKISDDEKSKLIWVCKIGEKIFKISEAGSEKEFQNKIVEILSIASQQLSSDKSEEALWKVMDTMMGDI